MTMQTKDQQVKHVVEGLALGVLSRGVVRVAGGKIDMELAFNRAWRSWARSGSFPAIGGISAGNQIWLGMGKSERRTGVRAGWANHAEPYLLNGFEQWSTGECLEFLADDRASAEDWVTLGDLLLDGLKPGHVHTRGNR
ncbi:hypothetical protein NG701_02165 [Pseudarthrobacter sp. HLT3-5]|uniref:hypothetical protein n=1 Tax=Pseudarthrobacter cellobiosi TaxID=2953654 RepID=UPI00208FDF68|nr:hypothetical protein [Pseudarthrobacter sp. HLT3-5]MCO4273245.1 hypothetical protein [Pseudarthrobacter sp. HLT3-5]